MARTTKPTRGIREKRPGVWEVRASTGIVDERGHYGRISKTVHGGKRKAETALRDLQTEIAAGNHTVEPPRTATLEATIEQWISSNTDRWAPKTLRTHRDVADRYLIPALGSTLTGRLKPGTIETQYAQWRTSGVGATMLVSIHRTLHAALNNAVRLEELGRNPASIVRKPQRPKSSKSKLTAPEVAQVLEIIEAKGDVRFASLVRTAVITGARRSELAALRWQDINLETGLIVIDAALTTDKGQLIRKETKTGSTKRIILDQETLALLRTWRTKTIEGFLMMGAALEPSTPIWRQRMTTKPMHPDTISQTWRRYADTAKHTTARFHDLRHCMGSTLIAAGIDPRTVADRMGHSTPTITLDLYTHTVEDNTRRDSDYLATLLRGDKPA